GARCGFSTLRAVFCFSFQFFSFLFPFLIFSFFSLHLSFLFSFFLFAFFLLLLSLYFFSCSNFCLGHLSGFSAQRASQG
ncbi:hypothetical protein FK507_28740, partial [Klebsiella pneumoniae]|nr:hypothetical protein [Klebsiella pneumoniae]